MPPGFDKTSQGKKIPNQPTKKRVLHPEDYMDKKLCAVLGQTNAHWTSWQGKNQAQMRKQECFKK